MFTLNKPKQGYLPEISRKEGDGILNKENHL